MASSNVFNNVALVALLAAAYGFGSASALGATQQLLGGGVSHSHHGAAGSHGQSKAATKINADSPEIDKALMICNGYAYPKALDVVQVRSGHRLTDREGAIAYKDCRNFHLPLKEGEQLDFKAGDLVVGTFFASGLPRTNASLLLIPHRKEPRSLAITFESHAFADLKTAQVAVIDAYASGVNRSRSNLGSVRIMDSGSGSSAQSKRAESLRFNSVVALNPGSYQLSLSSEQGQNVSLSASRQDKYVVMRVGNALPEGEGHNSSSRGSSEASFPVELVVFPRNAMLQQHRSGSPTSARPHTAFAGLAAIVGFVASAY